MKAGIRAPWAVTAIVAVGLLAACGGGGSDDTSTPTTQASGDSVPATRGANEGGVRRVAFVPPGPTDDSTPRGNQWYEFLTEGQCKALLDDAGRANPDDAPVIIYRAAAEACTGDHAAAARDLARYVALRSDPGEDDCGRDFVVAFVRDVLEAVKDDPGSNVTFVGASPRPPCQSDETTATSARRSTTTTR